MFSKTQKIISMILVFVITFTYSGSTLEALAESDGLSVITNGFSNSEVMSFKGYFGSTDNQLTENVSDVNEKATLIFEISPSKIREGFLKKGTIEVLGADGSESNFKFTKIKNVTVEEIEDEAEIEENTEEVIEDDEEFEDELDEEVENSTEDEEIVENEVQKNETQNEIVSNEVQNTIVENTTGENAVSNDTVSNTTNITNTSNTTISTNTTNETNIENTTNTSNTSAENTTNTRRTEDFITSRANSERTGDSSEENTVEEATEEKITESLIEESNVNNELINEEEVIEEEINEETYEELTAKDFEIEITKDNEISVENVIYNTIIEVEIEYNKNDEINVQDIYKEINLKLSGTYVDVNLEVTSIENNQLLNVGWSYNTEFNTNGEYTQFSPFNLGEHEGIIVENKINITRETDDENYLPVKQTKVEIDVPEYNGVKPDSVSVQAIKLVATKGEDVKDVEFSSDNWNYDSENGKVTITVTNENDGKANNLLGSDEYVITYKYDTYTEDEKVTMNNNYKVTVEEYSGKENIVTTKEFTNAQEIESTKNNLITYNISSTDDEINRAKINANYNFDQTKYESEFINTVNVNIMSGDLIEELKINSSKEVYENANKVQFDAIQDVSYSKVKFYFSEISGFLKNGGSIEIQNSDGELLYTLDTTLIKSQEDCEINLNNAKGVSVIFKNITSNGNITIDFTKNIGKSIYEKNAFNSFETLTSFVSSELKYKSYDETYSMTEIGTTKKIGTTITKADLVLTNNNLNTTSKNDSVELRIELNNDKEDSDWYVNPSFELVFPKYVSNVTLESIGLIYDCGLKIASNEIYTDENDGLIKMRIDLTGTQTSFSDNSLINGSNIVLSLNIELNEYTPKKQDQIKMYYCNEAVTNYESQTKWTIKKNIPNGILKDTNGFDVAIVNFQGLTGMVTSNAIINYDGKASKINSIKQGEKTAQISITADSQISTMELAIMNNTDNECTDGVFIGRIPTSGVKSIINNSDIGATVDTTMLGKINEATTNPNMTTIYYSTNKNATKDLKDATNGWTLDVTDYTQIKSYMIVVKGKIDKGTLLRFTYDFEIPEDLGYDQAVYGTFGGYYNNKGENSIKYETSEADKVGLVTEASPDLKVTVEPYGGNKNLYYGQIVELVAKVQNNTNEAINNATLKVSIPKGTVYTEEVYHDEDIDAYIEYVDDESVKEKEFTVDSLEVGEVKLFTFDVRVQDSKEDTVKLSGYTEINGTNKPYALRAKEGRVAVTTDIYKSNDKIQNGNTVNYELIIKKNVDDLNSLRGEFILPDYIKLDNIYESEEEGFVNLNYSIKDRTVSFDIGNLDETEKAIGITCTAKGIETDSSIVKTIFNVYEENKPNKLYSSNIVQFETEKINVDVTQSMNSEQFNFNDLFEYTIHVQNNSSIATTAEITTTLLRNFEIENSIVKVNGQEKKAYIDNDLDALIELPENGTIDIKMTGKVKYSMSGNFEEALGNIVLVKLGCTDDVIESEPLEVNVKYIDDYNPEEEEEDYVDPNYVEPEIEKDVDEETGEEYDWTDDNDLSDEEDTDEIEYDEDEEEYEYEDEIGPTQEELEEEEMLEDDEDEEDDYESDDDNDTVIDYDDNETETETSSSIQGNIFIDENNNGIKDSEENGVSSQIEVQLLKGQTMVAATTTDSIGNYKFTDLEPGDYSIIYNYDSNDYTTKINTENEETSVVESEEGTSVISGLSLTEDAIQEVSSPILEKDKFDLKVSQYLQNAIVTIKGEETRYDFETNGLTQIQIDPSDIDKADIKLTYKIIVENVGNVAGSATSIVDYIPNGMKFIASENAGWSLGTLNSNVYYDELKDSVIPPGETQEILLILHKDMTKENTGIISNKVQIAYTASNSRVTELTENNFATQETIVTLTQGVNKKTAIIVTVSLAIIVTIFAYMIQTGKLQINVDLKNGIKKVYK